MAQSKKKREIVATFKDCRGNIISLFKTHGEQWSIYQEMDGRITVTSMPRIAAKKEFRRIRKIRKPL